MNLDQILEILAWLGGRLDLEIEPDLPFEMARAVSGTIEGKSYALEATVSPEDPNLINLSIQTMGHQAIRLETCGVVAINLEQLEAWENAVEDQIPFYYFPLVKQEEDRGRMLQRWQATMVLPFGHFRLGFNRHTSQADQVNLGHQPAYYFNPN